MKAKVIFINSYFCVIACLLILSGITCTAQTPASTPVPITLGTPTPQRATQQMIDYDRQKDKSILGRLNADQERENKRLMAKFIDPIYRRPTEAELSVLAVDPSIKQIFASFLSQPGTGIVKLKPDFGCGEGGPGVPAADECRLFTLPGAGNAFSFRTRAYQMHRLADLAFRGTKFVTPGVLSQGIFVGLGDVPIETLGIDDARIKYLVDLRPVDEIDEIVRAEKSFAVGVQQAGLTYAGTAPVEMNRTYALRSIAYRGESVRVLEGAIFDELEYDKRRDVTVVFRTVGFERDGSIIVLWRELRSVDSPKIKYAK